MKKTIRIIKIVWWCVIVAPIGIMTAYNLYRQEINPHLPALIDILPNWEWSAWLSLFLFLIVLALIYELYVKSNPDLGRPSSAQANVQNDGVSLAAQKISRSTIQQSYNVIDNKKEPPNIIVGLSYEDQFFNQTVIIPLLPLPEIPNIDDLLAQKSDELMGKMAEYDHAKKLLDNHVVGWEILYKPDHYAERVKKYLIHYAEYLQKKYDFSILDDRYRVLLPVIENRSKSLSSNVIVEFYFPKDIRFPSDEIEEWKQRKDYFGRDYKPHKPKDPELFERLASPWDEFSMPLINQPITEEVGLEVQEQKDFNMVVYRIEKLVQNRPCTDLLPISIWLDNFHESKKFKIPIKVYAAELDEPANSYVEIELIVGN